MIINNPQDVTIFILCDNFLCDYYELEWDNENEGRLVLLVLSFSWGLKRGQRAWFLYSKTQSVLLAESIRWCWIV